MDSKADGRIVFVSDVHLYFGGDAYLAQFTRFLSERVSGARHLYIHGDLFDFYVGPRQGALEFYRPLFVELTRLLAEGTKVTVLHGNRDYLMGRRFTEIGCEVVPDAVVVDCGGTAVHLSHGDELCIHDRSYQFWARGVLRLAPIRFFVKALPVTVGVGLARSYRRVSKRKHQRMNSRSMGRLPTILDGAAQLLAATPYRVMICGHIHYLAETAMALPDGGECRLLTTGAWEEGPNYLAFEEGEFRIWRILDDRWVLGAPPRTDQETPAAAET